MPLRLIRFGTDLGYDPEDMLKSPDIDFRRYWLAGKTFGTVMTATVLGATAVGIAQGYFKGRRETQKFHHISRR